MNKVYACIDGHAHTHPVLDWASWSALRLDVPMELLHVLEREPARGAVTDYSGAIGLGAQETLLDQLSELDEQRGKLAQEAGRRLLAAATGRVQAAGVSRVDGRMRHGELLDSVLEMEPDARLFVLGKHSPVSDASRVHLDHHVERVIRSVNRPVLVANGAAFVAPTRCVIAFDGSPTAHKIVQTVARSRLLAGLPVLLAMAAAESPQARQQLAQAQHVLNAAGFAAAVELQAGEPEEVLSALVKAQGQSLLVMGAYGHSRIRQFIVGSTTTTLLRLSEVPVLILR